MGAPFTPKKTVTDKKTAQLVRAIPEIPPGEISEATLRNILRAIVERLEQLERRS